MRLGILAFGLVLLPAASPQEATEDLVRELEGTDVRKVYRAIEKLSERGAAAAPALEAAPKSDRAARYCAEALREIRLPPEIRRACPPPKRFSFKSVDRTAVEILLDLERNSGFKLLMEDLLEEEGLPDVPVDVADAAFLESLDAVCKAAGLSLVLDGGEIEVSQGGYVDAPKFFFGPYMVRLENYAHTRAVDFRKPAEESLRIDFSLTWEPSVRPCNAQAKITVVEAVDDRGKDLVRSEPPAEPEKPSPKQVEVETAEEYEFEDHGWWTFLYLQPLSPGASAIKTLRGHATLSFPRTRASVVLEKPQVGSRKAEGDFEIALKGLESEDLFTHSAELHVASAKLKPEQLRKLPIEVDLYAKGGRRLRGYLSPLGGEGTLALRVDFYDTVRGVIQGNSREKTPAIEKIEVGIVLDTIAYQLPFEFRDLKLR